MKPKEIQELKSKPIAELQKFFNESKSRLRDLKFNLAAGKVKNVKELHSLKKDMARTLTFIREKSN